MATVPNEEICCLLCLDTGEEQLLANNRCACKYNYHASCFTQYVKNNSCPLCQVIYTMPTQEQHPLCCSDNAFGKTLFVIIVICLIGIVISLNIK